MRILVADTLAKEGLDYLKQTGIEFDEKIGLKEPELAAIVGQYDSVASVHSLRIGNLHVCVIGLCLYFCFINPPTSRFRNSFGTRQSYVCSTSYVLLPTVFYRKQASDMPYSPDSVCSRSVRWFMGYRKERK